MIFWLTILLAFIWLGLETHWLTVRLPCGSLQCDSTGIEALEGIKLLAPAKQPLLLCAPIKKIDFDTPYWWQSPEMKIFHLTLCQNDYRCPYRKKCKDTERWTGWKLPAKTIKAWGTTMNLAEGCNIKRALFLKAMAREVNRKSSTPAQTPVPLFITQERTGSEKVQHGTRGGRRYYQHDDTYETVYHDCLVSKAWLKKHSKDVIPEPTMEVIVNGKTLSVNGNYKKGVVKEFIKVNAPERKVYTLSGCSVIDS